MRAFRGGILGAALAACSATAPPPNENPATIDGGAADARADVPAPVGDAALAFPSNTPGAVFVDVSAAPTDLAIVSSMLSYEEAGSVVIRWWMGEVENRGTRTLCFVSFDAKFKHVNGDVLDTDRAAIYTPPFKEAGWNDSIECLAPGKRGSYLGSGPSPVRAVRLADIARVELAFEATAQIAEPHPVSPKIETETTFVDTDGFTRARYVVRGASVDYTDVHLQTFYVGEDGLVAAFSTSRRQSLLANETWSFDTPLGTRAKVARVSSYVKFDAMP